MTALNDVVLRAGVWLTEDGPTLQPGFNGDVNLVTPGVIGFVVTLLVALATVFLLIDMNRRIRRTRYREEVRLQLEQEQADAAAGAPSASASDTPSATPPA